MVTFHLILETPLLCLWYPYSDAEPWLGRGLPRLAERVACRKQLPRGSGASLAPNPKLLSTFCNFWRIKTPYPWLRCSQKDAWLWSLNKWYWFIRSLTCSYSARLGGSVCPGWRDNSELETEAGGRQREQKRAKGFAHNTRFLAGSNGQVEKDKQKNFSSMPLSLHEGAFLHFLPRFEKEIPKQNVFSPPLRWLLCLQIHQTMWGLNTFQTKTCACSSSKECLKNRVSHSLSLTPSAFFSCLFQTWYTSSYDC